MSRVVYWWQLPGQSRRYEVEHVPGNRAAAERANELRATPGEWVPADAQRFGVETPDAPSDAKLIGRAEAVERLARRAARDPEAAQAVAGLNRLGGEQGSLL